MVTADGEQTIPERGLPRRAEQLVVCGWCGREFSILPRGRMPKWCSATCRHRAWEQSRAAKSGRAAVQIVRQTVEVERRVKAEPVAREAYPSGRGWLPALAELARQIDAGRVYDRDLHSLGVHLNHVSEALERRPAWRRLLD
jgi:hypothetical protein